ncbi:DUF3089 domain-containing protein [Sphingobium boeckii]|uniref:Pimeloyl-ACP methyl ester carboxylesterase n=1 Tax=Sphingobium boeckii TaxID=1082345 RepID=A0A7W9AGE9_9SPHN|nr:DUF3089 domain-containing protein [Sphingobium boeckii]MBB5684991.1 pimeloyl-ACP methyl ester carboxylesterase [Sphingobium boeckii]
MKSSTFFALVLVIGSPAHEAGAQLAVPVAASEFAAQKPAPAPDYALSTSWAAGSAGAGASVAVPAGASPAATDPAIDVFYIHPTTFQSKTIWNQDVADTEVNAWTDASVMARQASAFNGCCRIYAPRYRQASMRGDYRNLALDLAYGDIERAFDYYIKNISHGRPFILAGHSQGGYMVAELLEKRIDGTALQGRMVAAYVIGINLVEGDFPRRYKHIPICDTPSQTGCTVQWNSVLPTADLAAIAKQYEKPFVDKYGDLSTKRTLCINPITFDRAIPIAGKELSRGAAPGDPGEGTIRPLVPMAVSARCDHGLLVVDPDPALDLKPLPGGVMHYHDFGLFYADVRDNAILRTLSYLRAHARD